MTRIEISKRLVAINSASYVIKSVISLTAIFWIHRHLVRTIPSDEYEVLVLVYPLGLFVPIITMTVSSGLSRYVIEAYARGDMRRVTQITSTMAPFCLLAGLLVACVGAILTWNIRAALSLNPVYETEAQIMFAIVVYKAAQRACILPFTVGIEVKQKFMNMNIFGLGLEVLRISLVFALLYGVSTRALWMVVATIPVFILDDIVNFVYSRRLVPELRFKASEFRKELISPLMSFGGYTLLSRVAAVAREMTGPLFLAHFAHSVQVGSYRLGSYVETKFYPTVLGPMVSLQPALTGMNAIGQEDRLKRTFLRMSRLILWVFMFFAVPAMIFHREIWSVWLGAEKADVYSAGAMVMVLLFAKSIFAFPRPVIAQIALAKARNGPLALRVVVLELSTVALGYYMVRERNMGAIGVAAAGLIITAIGTPLLLWSFGLRMTDTRLAHFLRETFLPGIIPTLVATPVWLLAWYLLGSVNAWNLGLAGLSGCTVYAFVLIRYCLQPAERADLAKVFELRRAAKRNA